VARVRVQAEPFDLAAELAALLAGRPGLGGIGSFLGVVRSDPARPLAALELEHYPGMTEAAIARIAAEAERRWDLLGCTVLHRHGRLAPGAPIVLVLAGAAHRGPALQATGFPASVPAWRAPFWKREGYADGGAAWVAARAEDEDAAARW
jgi:molybdopterin synthase catalytic subunit